MAAPVGCSCLNLLLKVTRHRTAYNLKCRYICGTSVVNTKEKIVIPNRIKRSDTAILDELAKTVKQETGPRYIFMDDPYLYPNGILQAEGHSLAKASGQKAAQYVIKNHASLFEINPMDPMGEFPPGFAIKNRATSQGTIDELRENIRERRPSQAYAVYEKMKQEGESISQDIAEQLLALLCINNGENPSKINEIEQFHEKGNNLRHEMINWITIKPSWNEKHGVETVFKDLEKPSPESYNYLVRGRVMNLIKK